MSEAGRALDRASDPLARPRHRFEQRRAAGKTGGDRRGERAARTVRAGRRDAGVAEDLEARAVPVDVHHLVPLQIPAFDERGGSSEVGDERTSGGLLIARIRAR